MTSIDFPDLVAQAIASPSVHNVQPARWQIDGDCLWLIEDTSRRLKVGDPQANDAKISLGAAAEGLAIAASAVGLKTSIEQVDEASHTLFRRIARLSFDRGGMPDPLYPALSQRASWRTGFAAPSAEDRDAATRLGASDCTIASDPSDIDWLACKTDKASFGFMANTGFRKELRGWMRLKRSHPSWQRDGLNADAMQISSFEAGAAGAVLGPLFGILSAFGLARMLLSETKSFQHASGVMLFHRPTEEDPFVSGRHFHRAWLELEAAGFGANVLAALADDPKTAGEVATRFGIGSDRKLVSAFRFGRRNGPRFAPARLPIEEVLLR